MEQFKKDILSLTNITYRNIMFRLVNIYEQECLFNEGCLEYNDLIVIFNLFHFLESDLEC